MPTAAVIGAGPVGCLAALGLQQRGYTVTLYEVRPEEAFTGANLQTNARSINLAISTRGLTALSSVEEGIAKTVIQNAVPMRARMIHSKPRQKKQRGQTGAGPSSQVRLESQTYSEKGECIYSVSRNLLNRLLLDEVVKRQITIRWSHKLLGTDMTGGRKKQRTVAAGAGKKEEDKREKDNNLVELLFDSKQTKGLRCTTNVLVGCDGHHSKVRAELSRAIEMDFSQHYIDNFYAELHIPAINNSRDEDGVDFALDPNHLHIWPRHEYMLIALANQDKTFTSTLFAPKRIYSNHLQEELSLLRFFQEEFPDALELIGKEALVRDLMGRKPSSLATIECRPYHYEGKVILLGDAAHAMVPFYGQGLNCGLEDVRIMFGLMDKHCLLDAGATATTSDESACILESDAPWPTKGQHTRIDSGADVSSRRGSQSQDDKGHRSFSHSDDYNLSLLRQRAFDEYSSTRHVDLLAISQLALQNYHEMSSKVVSTPYLIRKQIDSLLVRHLPADWWSSLYTLVTFSNLGYHHAQQQEAKQRRFLNAIAFSSLATLSLSAAFAGLQMAKKAGWRK